MNRLLTLSAALALAAFAQQPPEPAPAKPAPGGPPDARQGPPRGRPGQGFRPGPQGPPMRGMMRQGPPGRWWTDSALAQKLELSEDQLKKLDEVYQSSRLKLIDANAALQKEETILEPLISADQLEQGKILAQIDRVAQARADLEKTNARMLLGLRGVLTKEQWKKLREEGPRPRQGQGPPPAGPRE